MVKKTKKLNIAEQKEEECRIVLSDDIITKLKEIEQKYAFGIYPGFESYVEKNPNAIIFNFDIMGLDYHDVYVLQEDKSLRAPCYINSNEFDHGTFHIPKDKDITSFIYHVLLESLATLLKEGLKTYFLCRHTDISIEQSDFEMRPLDKSQNNIKTIAPMRYIVLKSTKNCLFVNENGSFNIPCFQDDFAKVEGIFEQRNDVGLRVLNQEEFLAELDKLAGEKK